MKNSKETITREGFLETVIYSNEENFFTVARFRCLPNKNIITIIGNILSSNEEERLKITGTWQVHPKYGTQLKVDHFEVLLPTQKEAIEKYLASGLISGIKESLAQRIVKHFGEKTFEILDYDPDRLLEVSGIGKKKIVHIKESWQAQRNVHQAMMFLTSHGIKGSRAAKIYKKYGGNLVVIIKEHPYQLAIDIDGIGFNTADQIARNLGVPEDHPERLQAALLHIMNEARKGGHCYLPREELIQEAAILIRQSESFFLNILEETLAERLLITAEDNPDAIYSKKIYFYERKVAYSLNKILQSEIPKPIRNTYQSILKAEELMDFNFREGQKKAIEQALDNKVSVITGGPGVGKTTIIRSLVMILNQQRKTVALAAPTGRAAKRLSESAGTTATTIHRLLHYNPHEHAFEYNADNKLDADWLIIDEASMLDISLMHHLLAATPTNAAITFVGDCDQLPSVGPGNVLSDLMNSEQIAVACLTQIFRQVSGSSIVDIAHQINAGICPKISNHSQSDIFFLIKEGPHQGAETIVDLVKNRLPSRYNFNPLKDIQVLTPMYRGDVGADNLNSLLAKALNDEKQDSALGHFKNGDKVMQISNNYEKEVFNGDIGIVDSINRVDQTFRVLFDYRKVEYNFLEQDQLVLSYAISIHKSQGSEYPAVVIPLFTQHYIMLERNLLYTAITRGKKLVILVGSWKAMSIAVRSIRAKNRYTDLDRLLRNKEIDEVIYF